MSEIGGLIGNQSLSPQITIRNHTESVVLVESLTLRANSIDYETENFDAWRGWRSIPAGGTSSTTLFWKFNEPIFKILKDPVELSVGLKIGQEQRALSIRMTKSFGR